MEYNVRYNISPCDENEALEFLSRINKKRFVPNGVVKASARSHYDRYSYLCDENRVAVVFDVSAFILSVTGKEEFAAELVELFDTSAKKVKRSFVPAQGTIPVARAKNNEQSDVTESAQQESGTTRARLFVPSDNFRPKRHNNAAPTIFLSSKGAEISTDEIYPPQISKKQFVPPMTNDLTDTDSTQEYSYENFGLEEPPEHGTHRVAYGEIADDAEDVAAIADNNSQNAMKNFKYRAPVIERDSKNIANSGIAISANARKPEGGAPRRAVISFGTEDDGKRDDENLRINTKTNIDAAELANRQQAQSAVAPVAAQPAQPEKRKRGRPPKIKPEQPVAAQPTQPEKRRRGRPPKVKKSHNDIVGATPNDVAQNNARNAAMPSALVAPSQPPQPSSPTTNMEAQGNKDAYLYRNCKFETFIGGLRKLRAEGYTVTVDATEFAGTNKETKNYSVEDVDYRKIVLRYAMKHAALQVLGKRNEFFDKVICAVLNRKNVAPENAATPRQPSPLTADQLKLKRRLPNAYRYLSEQSKRDFICGINDLEQEGLRLSDYSVLLVPAFRALERYVFDLQIAEGIRVKMIGQAFDKNDNGDYILKTGYMQRIGSIVYAEVLVSLYTEYFSQRNFFAHSDNTGNNISRTISDRVVAMRIFNHILDVVEYNSTKLKEIGFSL